jgi:hypothetical protein
MFWNQYKAVLEASGLYPDDPRAISNFCGLVIEVKG